ncbi:hypothetical protein GWK09_07880 [Muriicola jejuensis]|uniref:Uncharacterized protein n=1 Tax=Muriicola jejuensis TaxID=504488 RepID=A0A6P0UCW8_9FLAO|nr:hypothetical protein [Muriicola jejuensis]
MCSAQTNLKSKAEYTLVDDNGIIIEKFDSTVTDENKFTRNNLIFREGVSFHYKFEHLDKDNQRNFFTYMDSLSYWHFVPETEVDNNTIQKVIISVKKGLQGFDKHIPDYSQTIIGYSYPTQNNYMGSISSASGVIENEANVWMHPPRDLYFEILELNPFPFIKAPYEIGTKWQWSLKIGDHWADGRWKLWSGTIENKYDYEITDLKDIETPFGKLECFVIDGSANSRIGDTHLRAYFNETYGFVRLEYTNIDGSKTNLLLDQFIDLYNGR